MGVEDCKHNFYKVIDIFCNSYQKKKKTVLPEIFQGQLNVSRKITEMCICMCVKSPVGFMKPLYRGGFMKSLGALHKQEVLHEVPSNFAFAVGASHRHTYTHTCQLFSPQIWVIFRKLLNRGGFRKSLYRGVLHIQSLLKPLGASLMSFPMGLCKMSRGLLWGIYYGALQWQLHYRASLWGFTKPQMVLLWSFVKPVGTLL